MVVALDKKNEFGYITFKGAISELIVSIYKRMDWGYDSYNTAKTYGNPYRYLSVNHLFCIKNYVYWNNKLVYQFRHMPFGSSNILNVVKLKDKYIVTTTSQVAEFNLEGKFLHDYLDEPIYKQNSMRIFTQKDADKLRESAYLKVISPLIVRKVNDFLNEFITSIELNMKPAYIDFYINTLLNYVCKDVLTKLTEDTQAFASMLAFEINTGTKGEVTDETNSYCLGLVIKAMTQYDGASEITLWWRDNIIFR